MPNLNSEKELIFSELEFKRFAS